LRIKIDVSACLKALMFEVGYFFCEFANQIAIYSVVLGHTRVYI
jgi:hypothetical protein